MPYIERLKASDKNVASLTAYCRGEDTILNEHELLLLRALTEVNTVHPLGSVVLGRGIAQGPDNSVGQPGRVEEDFEKPDGVWLEYVPA